MIRAGTRWKLRDILMPRFDPEMKTGRVVDWLKKEGDKVAKGEPLVRIDTEKVSLDVESPESGVLSKILVKPPAEVPVGTALGSILLEGERPSVVSQIRPETAKTITIFEQAERVPLSTTGEEGWRASPAARKAARDLGVDLNAVTGTGPSGRVTREDIERFHASRSEQKTQPPEEPKQMVREAATRLEKPVAGRIRTRTLDSMRSTIAQRMTESWTQIPQVPLFSDVSLVEAEKFKAGMEKLIGKRVSFTAIVAKALASALMHFPDLNSRFEKGEVQEYEDVDVSVAVDLDPGLIAPVIRSANKKTATQISEELEDLAARARTGKLNPSEVRGGTTTVSDLRSYGVDYFAPIINPPQVTILGVGKTRTSQSDASYCTLALVFDHRVTDGARAGRLLQKIKDFLESPYLLQMA